MDTKAIVKTLSSLERKVLPYIKDNITLAQLVFDSKISEVEVARALQFLSNKEILTIETSSKEVINLGKNGKNYLQKELPERIFLSTIKNKTLSLIDIGALSKLSTEEINVCIGLLKSKAALEVISGRVPTFKLSKQGEKLLEKLTPEEDLFNEIKKQQLELTKLEDIQKFAYSNLKKRKDLIQTEEIKTKVITLTELGEKLTKEKLNIELIESITPSILQKGSWKKKEFKEYDLKIKVPKKTAGRRHPYNEALNKIRNVFLEMGFQEMEGPWVETAFWGMDSMWIAQDHPMRDAQDTFYLGKKGTLPDAKYVAKVKAAHENGYNTGSTGHTKNWDPELAKELILRQHSTATTYRYLYEKKLNYPCKYFYIADNFRNETTDATHLQDFGQAEGFIVGDNLTLANLIGFVKEFYAKLGITKIKFKPTFNPYTEPSMEAHYYNEKMGRWYALINSGIFRPETLAPCGITKTVIAWGMGSSRIAAVLTGQAKLKDLFGSEVDFDWIKTHKRIKL